MEYLSLFITIFLTQVTFFGSSNASITENESQLIHHTSNSWRLPKNIVPTSYSIHVQPQFNTNEFIGKNEMKLHVKISTNRIVFNCGNNINITSLSMKNSQKGALSVISHYYESEVEQYSIVFNRTIPAKSVVELLIDYTGIMSNDMKGIYISSYWKYTNIFMPNETIVNLVGTNFRPTYARYAFPCFDEPNYKVYFQIYIERPISYISMCNLPWYTTTSKEKTALDIYKSNTRMPTYQITFFIMQLVCAYNSDTNVQVCTQPQNIHYISLALNISTKASSFFSSFFHENNQSSLVTMVGMPDKTPEMTASFKLLTFDDRRFLYDPVFTSDIDYQKIITTVIHGWTSMWFDDIIIPEQWSYVWINEGVATYLSYYAASETGLSSTSEQQIIIDHVHPALLEDGIYFSKSLTEKTQNLKRFEQIIDTITISKGCSIARMMHLTFGTEVFQSALISYATSRKHKLSTLVDFWITFQSSIDRSHLKLPQHLRMIMSSWTAQPGYPVLDVDITNNTVTLYQRRFSFDRQSSNNKVIWWIPLTWASASEPYFNDTSPKYWLGKKKATKILNIKENDWVIFNVQQTGFYRVNYDLRSWVRIINQLYGENMIKIPPINRAMIIDDLFNLARAGMVPYQTTLEAVSYISEEKEYLPIKAALTGLQYLYKWFTGSEYSMVFNNFFLKLIVPIYNALNDGEISQKFPSTVLLQAEIEEWVCKLGYEPCHTSMLEHFYKLIHSPTYVIPKNKKSLVYCTAVNYGLISSLVGYYFDSDNLMEKKYLREALKCIQNTTYLTSLLESAIRNEKIFFVNKQQSILIFKAITQNNYKNAEHILEFISSHRNEMSDYFEDQLIIADIISTAFEVLSTTPSIKKLKSFIEDNTFHFPTIVYHLHIAFDRAMFEIAVFENNYKTIVDWINKNEFIYWLPTIDVLELDHFVTSHDFMKSITKSHNKIIGALITTNQLSTSNSWRSKFILNFIKYLYDKFAGKNISFILQIHIKSIITPVYDRLGFEEKLHESIEDKLLRIELVKWACLLENTDCIQRSRQSFDNWKTNSSASLPMSLRRTILCTTIKWGNESDWNYIWIQYREALFASERDVMRDALGCSQNRTNIFKLLMFATSNNITTEESVKVFSSVFCSGLNGVEQTLDFMLDHRANIFKFYKRHKIIEKLFYELAYYLTTRKLFQKYTKCVDIYGKRYSAIDWYLNQHLVKAKTTLLDLDQIEMQAIKWLFYTYFDNKNVTLNNNVPKRYDIHLMTNLQAKIPSFDGVVNITFTVLNDTSFLVFDVGNLEIFSVAVYFSNHSLLVPLNSISNSLKTDYLISLNVTVKAETQLLVCITYKGYFNNIPSIFYRSYFIDQNEDANWLAATQIDKYGARKLFPCIGQTYFKAEFQLSVKRPHLYYSFTNMEFNSSENATDETGVWDHYKITEPMLPNNVTIIITDMQSLENYKTYLELWISLNPVINDDNVEIDTYYRKSKNDTEQVRLGHQQSGFYFVNSYMLTWTNLFEVLKKQDFGGISVNDRAQIIDDLFNLAKQKHIPLSLFLTGTQYLINERDILPWEAFLKCVSHLWNKFDDPEINHAFRNYLSFLMKPIYQYLGVESKSNETRSNKQLRGLILSWAVNLNYPDFINKSRIIFNEWRANADIHIFNDIPHSHSVICNVLKNGAFEEWKFVWQYTPTVTNNLFKLILARALACTNYEVALEIYLRHIFSDKSWMNDNCKILAIISLHNYIENGFDITINFLNQHADSFSWTTVSTLLPNIIKNSLSPNQISKLMVFINKNNQKIIGLNDEFYQDMLDLTEYAKWYIDCADDLKIWLTDNNFLI